MKKVISLALLCMMLMTSAQAQMRRIRETMERRREMNPPSGMAIAGASAVSVGAAGLVIFGYAALMSGRDGDNAWPALALTSGCVLVGGIVLLVVNHNHSGQGRFSVVSPQTNSLGIAYNFR